MTSKTSLPIDSLLPEIVAAVLASANVVLEAAPGAGKTTRVPAALLPHVDGEILVLEPRRIAARLAARQVAAELGEAPGETVGYSVRFEQVGSARTRLRFVTEGVLTRRLITDPELQGIGLVVLDEFHERHLDTDLALSLLRRLQQTTRPDLKMLIMSATLDTASVAKFLGGCAVLESAGRMFPLTVEHLPYSPDPLETRIANALSTVIRRGSGDTLVFLPGASEIRRAMVACGPLARSFDLELLPLHGDLTPAEQDRAVTKSSRRKVILATNVAESSITIDGVDAVIDSGLARIATTSPWTGVPTLTVGRVSQASLRQRAGRAGRTRPGLVVRLFPEEDFRQRPAHDAPEILRADLAQLILTLRVLHIEPQTLPWLDTPPAAAVEAADALLDRLDAVGQHAAELVRYPLPPRLARVLTEAKVRGVTHDACIAVALMSTRNATGNLLNCVDRPPDDARFRQTVGQLLRLAEAKRNREHNDDALLQSLLAGFPERVARVRNERQLLLASGVSAELATDAVQQDFVLALDVEDRSEKPLPQVRTFVPIQPEWLLDLFPERIRETRELEWNATAERVEELSALIYDHLALSETRGRPSDREAAAALLAERAMATGMPRFIDTAALENLLARIEFAGLPQPDLAGLMSELCLDLRSFAELEGIARNSLLPLIEQQAGQALKELAPTTYPLRANRPAKVQYERGKRPWIASRLQDFFGMRATPRIGPGKTPVVLHLLAPNQRAVQMTSDLEGFWTRLYPSVRRELMRRYPRHAWPESPL